LPRNLPEFNFQWYNKCVSAVFLEEKQMTVKMTMRVAVIVAATCFGAASGAQAAPLSVVNVAAPGINCVFSPTKIPNSPPPACSVVVNDSIGTFTPPGDSGDARLQSRTYPGTAPAPAAGDLAYIYRVDLTAVQGATAANCVTTLALDFGPVVKLPYGSKGKSDVFVVTVGGLGSVELASADQVGKTITFTFSKPVCPGATSYFFGLASKKTHPIAGTATVSFSLGGSATTADRVP
jgi:hypothetical protein